MSTFEESFKYASVIALQEEIKCPVCLRLPRKSPVYQVRGVFLKKINFWENLAAVLRRTTNFPGGLWENSGAVLMRTNIKNMWCFLKWVLLRTIVKFS